MSDAPLPNTRHRSVTVSVVLLLALYAAVTTLGSAGGQAAGTPAGHVSGWVLGISVLADAIKVAEVVVVLWGARQLWLGRGERKAAEQASAALARKAANYQAWQVVNTAQGKGGNGGRIDALQDLARNGVSLAGVRLEDAWLENIRLEGASLPRASLRNAFLRGAKLRGADLQGADLTGANLTGADLRDALLKGADVSGAILATAELEGADLSELRGWDTLGSVSYAQVLGTRHAPPGWREWMLARGAMEGESVDELSSSQNFSQDWRAV